jgi:uncharacterized protein
MPSAPDLADSAHDNRLPRSQGDGSPRPWDADISAATATQWEQLVRHISTFERVVVAFSGGVDCSVVAAAAYAAIGPLAVAVTAVSPALADGEAAEAAAIASRIGIERELIATAELARPAYRENGRMRCYHCKTELYDQLAQLAEQRGPAVVLSGANVDDLGDWRPGLRAATEHGVRHPLVDEQLAKPDVRALARWAGLPNADKVATPCLVSRVPYGMEVTAAALQLVDRAESAVRALGYGELRGRHFGNLGLIQIADHDLDRAHADAQRLVAAVRRSGFADARVDTAALRSGSLNAIPLVAGATR